MTTGSPWICIGNCRENKRRYLAHRDLLTREVVLVMEFDGDSYQRALKLAADKVARAGNSLLEAPDNKELNNEFDRWIKIQRQLQISRSRMYVIDAGLDIESALEKYPDRSKYLFLRGQIRPDWDKETVRGRISRVSIPNISVPLPYSESIKSIGSKLPRRHYGGEPMPPRYRVRIKVGQRLEPWIDDVSSMDDVGRSGL